MVEALAGGDDAWRAQAADHPRAVAVQFNLRKHFFLPVDLISGSRVETRRFQAMG